MQILLVFLPMFFLISFGNGFIGVPTVFAGDQVRIEDIKVMMSEVGPVVLLKAHDQVVPIFVDPTVAGSIEGALSGAKFHRPLSHDLMHTILNAFEGKVTQVVIRLKDRTYYGELTISLKGHTQVFDSRSSDAIALAIHFGAPIWVGQDVFEKVGEQVDGEPAPEVL